MKVYITPVGWKDSRSEDIHAVLSSAARQLSPYFPNDPPQRLEVSYAADGPIVLYQKSVTGAAAIHLSATGTFWSQFAYQFTHEFCHVLCHYERTRINTTPNYWFEESLCEAASLFALKRMSSEWSLSPPYPNWKTYAPNFAAYAAFVLAQYNLPGSIYLPDWYAKNARQLSQSPTLRSKNALVAMHLLPLLEKNPFNWGAVRYLNPPNTNASVSFASYLQNWYEHCPVHHQRFVAQLSQCFGLKITK